MVNTLIINSPLFRDKIKGYSEDSLPPLGLGYIATEIKKNNLEVELLDTVSENIPLDEIVEYIEDKTPEFTGMNIFSTNFELVREIIEKVTEETHFIIGGQVTKSTSDEIMSFNSKNPLDIIIGEGEYLVPDIITNKLEERPIKSDNNNRVFKVDNSSIYFPQDISKINLNRSFFKNEPLENKFGYSEANILTSRGCRYNCAFCGAARSLNKEFSIRIKPEESIKEDVDSLLEIYPDLESVRVLDDLFLRSVKDIQKADRIFRNKVYWRAMGHASSFKKAEKEDFKTLKYSGCNEIFMGIESGSDKILKSIYKPHNLKYLQKTVHNLLDSGINVKGYFIYGFPEETPKDMRKTYSLASKLKEDSVSLEGNFNVSVFQFRPYHGTHLYNRIKNKEKLNFKRNKDLNINGRSQFNFQAGNFSKADNKIIKEYVEKTMYLNKNG